MTTAGERLSNYLKEYMKMRSLDKEAIHVLHGGHEKEQILAVKDLLEVVAYYNGFNPQPDPIEKLLSTLPKDCYFELTPTCVHKEVRYRFKRVNTGYIFLIRTDEDYQGEGKTALDAIQNCIDKFNKVSENDV